MSTLTTLMLFFIIMAIALNTLSFGGVRHPKVRCTLLGCSSGTIPASAVTSDFQSTLFDVYIELTDAYGMMYHSNYLSLIERAILAATAHTHDTATSAWSLQSIKLARFKSAARLGDSLRVDIQRSSSTHRSKTVIPTNQEQYDAVIYRKSSYGNSEEEVFAAKGITLNAVDKIQAPLLSSPPSSSPVTASTDTLEFVKAYTIWRDELRGLPINALDHRDDIDSYKRGLWIPTRTIFNLWERARTDILGGPAELRRIMLGGSDDNTSARSTVGGSRVHVYVSKISGFKVLSPVLTTLVGCHDEKDHTKNAGVAGTSAATSIVQEVIVRTALVVSPLTIEFHQSLHNACDDGTRPLAAARIAAVCVDDRTQRPISIPVDVVEKMMMTISSLNQS